MYFKILENFLEVKWYLGYFAIHLTCCRYYRNCYQSIDGFTHGLHEGARLLGSVSIGMAMLTFQVVERIMYRRCRMF